MLGKLLKYEIPAMGRKLLPLYAAWLVTALFLGLVSQTAKSKTEFMVVISGILFTAVATAIFVMMIVLIVQRYTNSLLGDEAYFNHVLPVTVTEHIGNKAISATLWVFVTALVALLAAFLVTIGAIAVAGIDGYDLKDLVHDLYSFEWDVPKHFGLYVVEFLILFIAGVVKTVMQIYTAVTVGHQAASHTTLASIGAYIGVLIFEGTIGRALMPLLLKAGLDAQGNLVFGRIFVPGLLMTAGFIAVYFFICKYLMEKRLNLA